MFVMTTGDPRPCVACAQAPRANEVSPLCEPCLVLMATNTVALAKMLLARATLTELRSQRLLERIRGRISNNERTRALHPDPHTEIGCNFRINAYRVALFDAEQILKEE